MGVNGYDYENQAWVVDGLYQQCGHPGEDCDCYWRQRTVPSVETLRKIQIQNGEHFKTEHCAPFIVEGACAVCGVAQGSWDVSESEIAYARTRINDCDHRLPSSGRQAARHVVDSQR